MPVVVSKLPVEIQHSRNIHVAGAHLPLVADVLNCVAIYVRNRQVAYTVLGMNVKSLFLRARATDAAGEGLDSGSCCEARA